MRKIKSVDTIFDIIETIKGLDEATNKEIADHVGLAPSTTHQYLSTLVSKEYIIKEDDKYYLGLKFLGHGMGAQDRYNLTKPARSELKHLAKKSGETAWLIVEEYGHAVNIEKAMGEHAVAGLGGIGLRLPMHCGAGGKSILAHLPEDRVDEIIDRNGLPMITENTVSDRDTLFEELEKIRSEGVAFNVDESIDRQSAVASPIVCDGTVEGAVALAGPTSRLQEPIGQEFAEYVRGAANAIELTILHS
jgi:DNA-binding IclR family transcriptional regulator